MFATLALSLLAPFAGAAPTPIEPIEPAMIELFLSTDDAADSSCGAYTAAGELGALGGDVANVTMMQDMTEAYLIVQFETIWSADGSNARLTDEARDAYHLFLTGC